MNYWQNRILKNQEKLSVKTIKSIQNQLSKYYSRAARRVINDFENVLNKLLATVEAGKEPTPADLYKLDKYWEAQAQLRRELEKLGNKEISILSKAFETNYFEVYYSLNLPNKEVFNKVDKEAALHIINAVWCADGKAWSQRVWDNTERLAATLNEELIHIVTTGKKTTELKNKLQERFNVSYHRAETLVRTELNHIQTEAAAQRYKDYGLEMYEILGNEDDSCGNHSVDCHKMDGKRFYYNEKVVGVNAPPFHPNCRCVILPVID